MTRSGNDAHDASAMARCVQGDARAIDELYERYGGSCLSLARRILGNPHHAQDAVQEAFLDLWRDAARFDPNRSSVRAWLLLLTHRNVERIRREQCRKGSVLLDTADREKERAAPAQQAGERLVGERTREALAALAPVDREALALAYWGGSRQREISAVTSTPLPTIKSRMHTAMKDLRMLLDSGAPADEGAVVCAGSWREPAPGEVRAQLVDEATPPHLHAGAQTRLRNPSH